MSAPTKDVGLSSLSAVAGDLKRAAIVVRLFDNNVCEKGPKLKEDVETLLGRPISHGSFGWHIAQLRAENIVKVDEQGRVCLTKSGADVAKIVREPLLASLRK